MHTVKMTFNVMKKLEWERYMNITFKLELFVKTN